MTIDSRFYELIDHLWQGGRAAYLWTPDNGAGEKYSYWLTLPPGGGFTVPKMFYDRECYFGVHPSVIRRSEHERTRIRGSFDIAAINCLYFEIDCKTEDERIKALEWLDKWHIKPACIIYSGGGFHVYILLRSPFILDTPEKQQRAMDLQWAMVKLAGGDTSVNDLARVLRVPGTLNHKSEYGPDSPTIAIERWDMFLQHDLTDLEPLLQPYIDKRNAAKKAHTPSPQTVSLSDQQLLDVLFRSKHGDLYRGLWIGNLDAYNGDHSDCDQVLCNGLAWVTGKDINTMDRLFRQSGLYRNKWERDDYRESTLNNAASSAQTVYDPSHNGHDSQAQNVANAYAASGGNGNGNGSQPPPNNTGGGGQSQPSGSGPFKAPNNPTTADYIKSLKSLGYHFRLNDLDNLVEVNGHPLDDVIAAKIKTQMRDIGYKRGQISEMEDAYLAHAGDNRYHPIKEYLQNLQWNGDDHIRLLARYFQDKHSLITYNDGSTKTVFHAWLTRWLIGSVAKVFKSGDEIKVQNAVLVIEGSQNLGKSTFASWLCSGASKYFIEQAIDPGNKDHERRLAGKWIWEIGEMGSTTRKADRESLKNFLTQTEVTFRTPYAKYDVKKSALANFIGTVNNEGGFLQDSTGTRRFMTVGLVKLDHTYIKDFDVNQVWAQAYELYRSGETWRLLPEEAQKRDELNGDYKVEDPYEGWIKRYFDVDLVRGDARTPGWFTTTQEIVSELKNKGVTGDTSGVTIKLAATMKELGLEKDRFPRPSGPRGYWGVKIKP